MKKILSLLGLVVLTTPVVSQLNACAYTQDNKDYLKPAEEPTLGRFFGQWLATTYHNFQIKDNEFTFRVDKGKLFITNEQLHNNISNIDELLKNLTPKLLYQIISHQIKTNEEVVKDIQHFLLIARISLDNNGITLYGNRKYHYEDLKFIFYKNDFGWHRESIDTIVLNEEENPNSFGSKIVRRTVKNISGFASGEYQDKNSYHYKFYQNYYLTLAINNKIIDYTNYNDENINIESTRHNYYHGKIDLTLPFCPKLINNKVLEIDTPDRALPKYYFEQFEGNDPDNIPLFFRKEGFEKMKNLGKIGVDDNPYDDGSSRGFAGWNMFQDFVNLYDSNELLVRPFISNTNSNQIEIEKACPRDLTSEQVADIIYRRQFFKFYNYAYQTIPEPLRHTEYRYVALFLISTEGLTTIWDFFNYSPWYTSQDTGIFPFNFTNLRWLTDYQNDNTIVNQVIDAHYFKVHLNLVNIDMDIWFPIRIV
ncbi:hypothetical protein [Spiroplasma sp. DGKH1]|uniref:hypothetical protein n=1 Tax=Spiroplasma sp. DGKH1 TaxID=3050074 RepID=UPI0034C65E30